MRVWRVLAIFLMWMVLSTRCLLEWFPPFNDSNKIVRVCNNELSTWLLYQENSTVVNNIMQLEILCEANYHKRVQPMYALLIWFMRSLKFCEINHEVKKARPKGSMYQREFQRKLLRYTYALFCKSPHFISTPEEYEYRVYTDLFRLVYHRENKDRMTICAQLKNKQEELYAKCHVNDSISVFEKKCLKVITVTRLFQRFSMPCKTLDEFMQTTPGAFQSVGAALSNDTSFMNLLSGQLKKAIYSESMLPSVVLKTRLFLQHYSLAAVKLDAQFEQVRACQEGYVLLSESEGLSYENDTFDTNNCCNSSRFCEVEDPNAFKSLFDETWQRIYVELVLLLLVCINTVFLTFLLLKTKSHLSTATVLFVFNIVFSNLLFLCSFSFLYSDLFNIQHFPAFDIDHADKSAHLLIAESLQTHLLAVDQYRRQLVQETLYSLAQNGSLIGLIHLLLLVLVVITRSMSGHSTHLSRRSVISVFACVWMFLITSHVLFSALQITAIDNLSTLSHTLNNTEDVIRCNKKDESHYQVVAQQCDKSATFYRLGAYLLRGHTLFTVLFLCASIVIFVSTTVYHWKLRRKHDFLHSGIRDQFPYRRREMLFHTLLLSIATFFLSVLGQTYIELAIVWEDDKETVASLSQWYHVARIAAFLDPLINPIIVIFRTPLLRKQMGTQWESVRRSRDSSTRYIHAKLREVGSRSAGGRRRRRDGRDTLSDTTLSVTLHNDKPVAHVTKHPITRSVSRRSTESRVYNSVV